MKGWIITVVKIMEGNQENINCNFLWVMALLPFSFKILIFSRLPVLKLYFYFYNIHIPYITGHSLDLADIMNTTYNASYWQFTVLNKRSL